MKCKFSFQKYCAVSETRNVRCDGEDSDKIGCPFWNAKNFDVPVPQF